jgi:hypothetical protein
MRSWIRAKLAATLCLGITGVIAFTVKTPAKAAQTPARGIGASIGIAAQDKDGNLCLALPGPAVKPGEKVTLVGIDRPQRSATIEVGGPLRTCAPLERPMVEGPYYSVMAMPASLREEPAVWIALRGTPAVRVSNGTATIRLDASTRAATVRSCTSNEGLHLTVWSGTPLTTRRLWHQYYYLGFDVEPSCEDADYRE